MYKSRINFWCDFYKTKFFIIGAISMAKKEEMSGRKKDERIAGYVFALPAVALLLTFLVVPIVYTVYYSVFQYQVMRPNDILFVGLENYKKLFSDSEIAGIFHSM